MSVSFRTRKRGKGRQPGSKFPVLAKRRDLPRPKWPSIREVDAKAIAEVPLTSLTYPEAEWAESAIRTFLERYVDYPFDDEDMVKGFKGEMEEHGKLEAYNPYRIVSIVASHLGKDPWYYSTKQRASSKGGK